MKFSRSTKILDKQVVELDVSLEVAIERLMAQQGLCYTNDNQGSALTFYCSKKGEFSVYNASTRSTSSDRIYSVRGEVFVENGKTKAAIYTVHDRATRGSRWVILFVYLVLWAATVFFQVLEQPEIDRSVLTRYILIGTLFLIGIIIATFSHTKKEEQNKDADIDIMKNESIRRLEAVNRWDD